MTDLQVSDLTADFDQVKAGDFPVVSLPGVVLAGQSAVIAPWSILQAGAADGEYELATTPADAIAVSVEEIDATGADDISTVVYITGEYLASGLSFDAGLESAPGELDPAAVAALRAVNIYVK